MGETYCKGLYCVTIFRGSWQSKINFRLQVDNNDPNATKTLSRLEAVQKTCRASGALSKRYFILSGCPIEILNILPSLLSDKYLWTTPGNPTSSRVSRATIQLWWVSSRYRKLKVKGLVSFQKIHTDESTFWMQIVALFIILAIVYAYLSASPRI